MLLTQNDIINGKYTSIIIEKTGEIEILCDAEIICNGLVQIIGYCKMFEKRSDIITYKELTELKFPKCTDLPSPTMPKMVINYNKHSDKYKRKQKKYNRLRRNYRVTYEEMELLIKNHHNYHYVTELKYFLLKEYVTQHFDCVDKCLIYDMFDILHYFSNMLCYHSEIDSNLRELDIISHNGVTIISNQKYNFELCENDSSIEELYDSKESYDSSDIFGDLSSYDSSDIFEDLTCYK